MAQEDHQSSGMYLILGALLGAAISLLFAPQSGREIRSGIRDRAQRTMDRVRSTPETLNARISELLDNIGDRTQELVERAGLLTQEEKDSLHSAIESDRSELERLRKRLSHMH